MATTLAYDASGNTTSEGSTSYTYDERNRLTSVTGGPGGSVAYTYDAMGRLLTRRPMAFGDSFGATGAWTPSDATSFSAATDGSESVYKGQYMDGGAAAWRSAGTLDDYEFSARVKITEATDTWANAGVLVRSDGLTQGLNQNQYLFQIFPNQDKWQLYKTVAGDWTLLEDGPLTIDLNRYYELKVVASGTSLTCYIDGVQQITLADASIASGGVGLAIYKATTLFDDARLYSLNGATTYRYSDASGDLLNELDASGNVTASYVLDSDGDVIALVRGASKYFLHYNAHGDVVAITGESGAVIAKFSYDPWGLPTEYNAAGSIVPLGSWDPQGPGLFFLFGGMVYDVAAGLYLTRTRAYNPRTGRFIQRDILDEKGKRGVYAGFPFGGDQLASNLYVWCNNSPINLVDKTGYLGISLNIPVDAIEGMANAANNLAAATTGSSNEDCYICANPTSSDVIDWQNQTWAEQAALGNELALAALAPPPEPRFVPNVWVEDEGMSPGGELALGLSVMTAGAWLVFSSFFAKDIPRVAHENADGEPMEEQDACQCGYFYLKRFGIGLGGIVAGSGLIIHAGLREGKEQIGDAGNWLWDNTIGAI